ncbi:FHA domain-containing protein [Chloracidobacterium aggregatum]|uniref:FHA domain-containing protein n=1 Tax=Chloracidobacterium sp. N TaxID=2821540 RepID=A0ABX8B555_9BACT|nr:FHA domain-containing protein [Chloracidobacterium aggregatum]QUV85026.1 FHA domain-containing protein [Chloracidobacterium sp. 2]QUV88572.1 FHA domain-containing protein [Chloracidobacterium sp. S]QUV91494.1 FHA domain-containing protein [Chloracidobacterium sp. A]QUV94671.1 FHA domain-containing protein [Chloracidobacterium sp. N]QUV97874.1 FHA domain-containing protein [Chloracidobacterium sp. E]
MTSNNTGEITCSVCGASNAADWLYCQQCGSPLKSEPASVARSAPPGGGGQGGRPVDIPPTVVVPPVVPPTVVAQPAVPPTVVAQPVPPPVPPTVIAQPVVPPTVVAQPAPPVPPTVVAQPAMPPVPPTVMSRSPAADGAAETVICDQCGKVNPATSSFCAGCGAPLPSPLMKTIVRTSERPPTRVARLCLIQEGGGDGEVYEIKGDELTIGRNSGDIRFPHDGYMSGRHARIIRRGDEFILQDDNSRNGTFKKIDGPVTLKSGDIVLIGKQLFRFEA